MTVLWFRSLWLVILLIETFGRKMPPLRDGEGGSGVERFALTPWKGYKGHPFWKAALSLLLDCFTHWNEGLCTNVPVLVYAILYSTINQMRMAIKPQLMKWWYAQECSRLGPQYLKCTWNSTSCPSVQTLFKSKNERGPFREQSPRMSSALANTYINLVMFLLTHGLLL
jgi:hypothetical protein